ncbi:12S rRNA N4-methylcytidine (m4C) methyltransferase isoform X3 [Centrocercus urophasianus]|uniref:12S rRNA N4-methylcytidine (m4C) methyltransferase isoform X3 n=1 Tax=Centrocercus urophasianus TaxID=9002 RepID=UPI001C652AB5|nr:12S rRNA N4-methylcytidine (m4C) methyltransferase isoform X3 [Centrocercus urophasianus]
MSDCDPCSGMINFKMLSQSLCQVNKCLLLCNLKLNPVKLAVLARRIYSSVKQLSEYDLTEQTTQESETKELLHSTENKTFGRLHIPVMVEEVINFLSPQSGQRFLDMTFGAGGHSTALLEKASNITIYALDRDPMAYKIAQQLSESYPKQIQALLGQFSQSEALLISSGVEPGTLDGVLLDAGCSSMQFDTPERGFSLQKDGPLDMRMDSDRYPDMPTAADVVNALDQQALASILRTYGEEKHAKKIASAIVQARSIYPITRTQQLASIVAAIVLRFNLKHLRKQLQWVIGKRASQLSVIGFTFRKGDLKQKIIMHLKEGSSPRVLWCFSSISIVCTKRSASETYTHCYQNFPRSTNICE